jgi:hypothetical protein
LKNQNKRNTTSEKWPLYKEFLEYQASAMDGEDQLPEERTCDYPSYVRVDKKISKITNQGLNQSQGSLSKQGYSFGKGKTTRLPGQEVNCGVRIQKLPSYETKNLKELNNKRKLDAWRSNTDRDYDKLGRLIAKTEMHDAKIYSAKLDEKDILYRANETDEERLDRIAWECSSRNLFANSERNDYLQSEALRRNLGHNYTFNSHSHGNETKSLNPGMTKSEIDGFNESYGIMQTSKGKVYTFFCEKYGLSK